MHCWSGQQQQQQLQHAILLSKQQHGSRQLTLQQTLILNNQVKEATEEKEWFQGGGMDDAVPEHPWPILEPVLLALASKEIPACCSATGPDSCCIPPPRAPDSYPLVGRVSCGEKCILLGSLHPSHVCSWKRSVKITGGIQSLLQGAVCATALRSGEPMMHRQHSSACWCNAHKRPVVQSPDWSSVWGCWILWSIGERSKRMWIILHSAISVQMCEASGRGSPHQSGYYYLMQKWNLCRRKSTSPTQLVPGGYVVILVANSATSTSSL